MNKIVISKAGWGKQEFLTCAFLDAGKIMEIAVEGEPDSSLVGNIYVGQVESISENIGAAFVKIAPDQNAYLQLSEVENLIFCTQKKNKAKLSPGDLVLVQVSRDAMKGKLPALSAKLSVSGKYIVLTTANTCTGYSGKLQNKERLFLEKWVEETGIADEKSLGMIVRTNAAAASKKDFSEEYEELKNSLLSVISKGPMRTLYSVLYRPTPFYIQMIRDALSSSLEEVVTDLSPDELDYDKIRGALRGLPLRFYEDRLLPLSKLYNLRGVFEEILSPKVWLKSGGFLIIQQTEAFVSIDVNSGKYVDKKKQEETYRKINREAALEIARQLRLRNLSGIILVDFINMKDPDHTDEVFHVLKNALKSDHVKASVIDITPLGILEMTRKKVHRPVCEDLGEKPETDGMDGMIDINSKNSKHSMEEKESRYTKEDVIWKLETNIDDCTGEHLGYLMNLLLSAGARDVNYMPIFMKKNRPAYQLEVICKEEMIPALENMIFKETTTIGIRRVRMQRTILQRKEVTVQTPYGELQAKECTLPDGSRRLYPEYESAALLAKKNGVSLMEVTGSMPFSVPGNESDKKIKK